jgi:type III pantothenate kinase
MILAFDVGNTFIKWGFIQADKVVASGRALHRERGLAATLGALSFDRRPDTIVAVNVAGPAAAEALGAWAKARFGHAIRFIDSRDPHPALRSRYSESGRLGADRWAAAVGGFVAYGSCIVADLGTAATVDWVDADGTHRGGYIVPGIDAMRAALAADTHAVQVDDRDVAPGSWGMDTGSAVAAGTRRALAALIESTAREQATAGATLVLTGGDAERVAPWLFCRSHVDHALVLRGAVALAAAPKRAGS